MLAAVSYRDYTVMGAQEPERVLGMQVTPSYFPVLGVALAQGRGLAPDSGGSPEVVLGYGYWQRRFGGSPTALGQRLTLNDTVYTVVGIMPRGIPDRADLWTRLSFTGQDAAKRDSHYLGAFGRLAAGVSPEGAAAELRTIAQRLAVAYPAADENWTVVTVPLIDQVVGKVRPALVMLLAAAACVLLIGAANLANLFLVRSLARQRELAVRTALGAARGRIVRELLVEAGVLGLSAGALGVRLGRGWCPGAADPRLRPCCRE